MNNTMDVAGALLPFTHLARPDLSVPLSERARQVIPEIREPHEHTPVKETELARSRPAA
ncbi:hypothetical protein JYU34_017833 [Plutella xylostella]|uniref:Uncharacterized protein n=2 Tax=Plutella xylostella TaxID=51655 RepID=A0ABQ7Q231_PLUXY|nr:hypothetical protein JYU34_017833 [Plutella xylostella]